MLEERLLILITTIKEIRVNFFENNIFPIFYIFSVPSFKLDILLFSGQTKLNYDLKIITAGKKRGN